MKNMNATEILACAFVLMFASQHQQANAQCPADVNHDQRVDAIDLAAVVSAWGTNGSKTGTDINDDGLVEGADLTLILSSWGQCPTLTWATVLEWEPDAAVVTNGTMRNAITASGLPWRVRDNSSNIEMLLVPPGTFQMGCIMGSDSENCSLPEQPVHTVTLTSAYYLGRYEVTQAQWQAQMGSNPSFYKQQADSPSRPVEQVSWNTIQNFLSATALRLPTEAEWEFACRAGTTTPFHSGPGFPNGTTNDDLVVTIAWYHANSRWATHAVGGKAANALGMHDMLGNVWEWQSDCFGWYSSEAQTNPTGPVSGLGPVLRGGSWGHPTDSVRSSGRTYDWPDGASNNVGFRVARAPS